MSQDIQKINPLEESKGNSDEGNGSGDDNTVISINTDLSSPLIPRRPADLSGYWIIPIWTLTTGYNTILSVLVLLVYLYIVYTLETG
jgi:hypothetical protein